MSVAPAARGKAALVTAESGDAVDAFSWAVAWILTEATEKERGRCGRRDTARSD